MNEKLTYEEWRSKFVVSISDEAKSAMKFFHNLDADKEIESALRNEYELECRPISHITINPDLLEANNERTD